MCINRELNQIKVMYNFIKYYYCLTNNSTHILTLQETSGVQGVEILQFLWQFHIHISGPPVVVESLETDGCDITSMFIHSKLSMPQPNVDVGDICHTSNSSKIRKTIYDYIKVSEVLNVQMTW